MIREELIQEKKRTSDTLVMSISHLSKAFGSNQVLTDFNMEVYKGENVVVLGKSGSGKSVLIKCIICLNVAGISFYQW